jgi:hypothetical protein
MEKANGKKENATAAHKNSTTEKRRNFYGTNKETQLGLLNSTKL